jgi:formate C-acetyltransferase
VTVVDSLAAIKHLVFDEGRCTLAELRQALTDNWEGHEALHRAVRLEAPSYGNDDPWINELFARVAGVWCDGIEGQLNYYGGPVLPGFLGWTVWIHFGEQTGATPDGRRAGEPLANSMAPRSGARLKGTPSMILSAGGFDNTRGLGGTTYNVRFSGDDLAAEGGPDRLKAIVETALGTVGLYMLQIDMVNTETLRAAQQSPDDYRDLFVRIGGYLVPFTYLPPHAQEDVIQRTELGL